MHMADHELAAQFAIVCSTLECQQMTALGQRITRRHFVVLSGTNFMEKIRWRVSVIIFLPNKRLPSSTANKNETCGKSSLTPWALT